jgi:hypothetical protein
MSKPLFTSIASTSRRRFLVNATQRVLPALVLSVLPASAAFSSTPRSVINVRRMGVVGDGQSDDTDALQAAMDAAPPGSTVYIPAGDYWIDASKSIRPRSGIRLSLDPQATLRAIPNDLDASCVLLLEGVSSVEIAGGCIVGERDDHLGTTGEWGHGISIRGSSNITLRDISISQCWGDGIYVGASSKNPGQASDGVMLERVVCTRNRRQGLSITQAKNVQIWDSEFSDTGGTMPGCGIDIEPNPPYAATHIQITGCKLLRNDTGGLQIYKNVSNVTVDQCIVAGNTYYGVIVAGASGSRISATTLTDHGRSGISVREGAHDCELLQSSFRDNARQNPTPPVGTAVYGRNDVEISTDCYAVTVSGNSYSS